MEEELMVAKFIKARRFRAARLGITPEQLAREQEEAIASSTLGMDCPDDLTIEHLVAGEPVSDSIRKHCADCELCRATIATLSQN